MKIIFGEYPEDGSERPKLIEIHDEDMWSLDNVLAHIILACLKKYRETDRQGVPASFVQAADEYNATDEELKYSHERYLEAIDDMIYAFNSIVNDYGSDKYYIEDENAPPIKYIEMQEDGSEIEHEMPMKTRFDREAYDIEQEKIKKGLELFAKHFSTLWT